MQQAADGEPTTHNFHQPGDLDWTHFTATAGVTYTLKTNNTGGDSDTVLSLYDIDSTTLLVANDDDYNTWPASRLDWRVPADGTYYIKIYHWDPYGYGCTTAYELVISPDAAPAAIAGLTIGAAGEDLRLAWPPVTTNALGGTTIIDHYEIHRSATPYFTTDAGTLLDTTAETTYYDTGAYTTAFAYYYAVITVDTLDRRGEPSNGVGKVQYTLVGGS